MKQNNLSETFEFLSQEEGFLGVKEEYLQDNNQAQAIIVPFGLEASVTYGSGTRSGPRAIIKASHKLELFDEEHWSEVFRKIGIATLKEPQIQIPLDNALNQIEDIVEHILNAEKFPFLLGGEHSMSIGAIRPFIKKYPDLAILHFDAHANLKDGYAGQQYSHNSVLRRIMDNPISTSISFGIRNISSQEVKYLEENKGRIYINFMKDIKKWDIDKILKPLKGRPVYITFDLDGFDPSLMQATGTPEPGGLFWNDVIQIISKTAKTSNIVGADIAELAPIKQFHSCDFLAAKLCYKILGYAFQNKIS